MLVKVILVFLVVMALLGMVGRAVAQHMGQSGRGIGLAKGGNCPHCATSGGRADKQGRKKCSCGER